MRKKFAIMAAAAAALAIAGGATAAVTFNSETGAGFVGKGDVQLVYGWNNAQLQATAGNVRFRYDATELKVTEVSWICTNSNNEKTQERERTTTTTSSTQGIVSSIARERNQITGFNLTGYSGDPTTSATTSTEGPVVNSCPSGPWSLTTPAGDPAVLVDSQTGGLQVSNGGAWSPIG